MVAVLMAAQVVSELGFSFSLPFTPLYVQELGVDDVGAAALWSGLMAGAFAVAMGGMAPIWGALADRYGHRLMVQRAFFGAGLAIGSMALAQTPEQLLVLRVLHGIFTGVVTAIATLVSLTAPRAYLATVLGMMQAAFFLGITLGPLLGGAFADRFGFRATFGMTGLILVSTGLLVTLLVREPARERTRPDARAEAGEMADGHGTSSRGWLLRREVLAAVLLMAVVRFASMAPQPILPLFVQQLVDTPEGLGTTVGLVLAATGIASSASALIVGRISDRFGRRATLLWCLLLATVATPLHAAVTGVWQLVVLRTLVGISQGGTSPAIQALLVDVTPTGRRGTAFGLLTTANALGGGGGPAAASVVAAAYGVPAVFVVSGPVFAAAAMLLGWIRPARHGAAAPGGAAREAGRARLH